MTEIWQQFNSDQWMVLFTAALLIGMAKAGIKGLGMFIVPMMAAAFGGKVSVGLVLPMLSMADVFAVSYYNRHAEWHYIKRLLPTAVVGVLVAIGVGYYVNDAVFTDMIAVIIISSLILLILQEQTRFSAFMSGNKYVAAVFGGLGGFTTMIGNAAGPVMAVYLLSTRIPKNNFIGTTAWFFMIINLFKFPFHILVWETITWHSFRANLLALPVIVLGVFAGILIVKRIPEQAFRYFVIVMTFMISLKLLLGW
ncbi:MAG: sulfite exporter TauE/SafE family protein [Phaeodactylibacter sp.]|uniref:sulfite exporter TauE/SafE family protein n=1 Tax=Phaeodactylibacter sp. TaxID=1940289 RepID=UPI0032EF4427